MVARQLWPVALPKLPRLAQVIMSRERIVFLDAAANDRALQWGGGEVAGEGRRGYGSGVTWRGKVIAEAGNLFAPL